MHPFLMAFLGGLLIGLRTSLFLLFKGRVFGISGIIGGLIRPLKNDFLWRIITLLGLVSGGFIAYLFVPQSFPVRMENPWIMVVAGLLVGFGTQLGGGCTSGHGVCGISRLSPRSIAATITFILAGIITVTLFSGRF